MEPGQVEFQSAIQDFRRARRRAALQDILSQLRGRPANLLSYEDVSRKLKASGTTVRGLREIPISAIVGSVGRYADFNRSFLPRLDTNEERWADLKVRVSRRGMLSPIRVYQIGDAYFVSDGNHRVSVARQLGATSIQAHVTEVHTRVPLSPQDNPDDLILKAEYAGFLEHTRLDTHRPGADLRVTVPGQYQIIEEHIEAHRYGLARGQARDIPLEEAVDHWYDQVYLPVVQVIRDRGTLRDFPGRTETDLYVWIAEHRAELEKELGWEVRPQEVAEELVELSSPRPRHVLGRVGEWFRGLITPLLSLQRGPPAGHWRREHLAARHDDHLFRDILVAVSGQERGWCALDQAIEVGRREGARLFGLHVVASEEEGESESTQTLRDEFDRRCQAAGLEGRLTIEVGVVAHKISQLARWVDLVALSLTYTPAPQPLARFGSGLSTLLRYCPRPILTVPEVRPHLNRALLAYDGSPKAEEALFVATYLAACWKIPLVVVTVMEQRRTSARTLARAQRYLEKHGVEATLAKERGPVARTILNMAESHESDLIIMGGYGHGPVLEVVLGSAVEETLRASRCPMLICR